MGNIDIENSDLYNDDTNHDHHHHHHGSKHDKFNRRELGFNIQIYAVSILKPKLIF